MRHEHELLDGAIVVGSPVVPEAPSRIGGRVEIMPEEAGQNSTSSNGRSEGVHPSSALAQVAAALQGLKYGQITITVQDGVVVQIERLERMRLNRRAP